MTMLFAFLLLFSAQEADAGGEGAAFAGGEGGLRMRSVEDVIDYERIAAAADVVEATAEGEIVAEEMKALFELEVEGDIVRKALCAGFANELLLVGEEIERESGAGFERVGDFELMDDGKLEQRKVSPGKESVGSVPEIGARLLGTEDGVVNVEIESLIAVGAGAGVGAHEHVSFAEVVAERNLQAVVTIFTCVLEEVISVGAVVESVVDESVGAATVEELSFQIDCGGKFLFEGEAPVEK